MVKEFRNGKSKHFYNSSQELHREDGPAREWASGTKEWYLNGKKHREDGPARISSNGSKEWWLNGKLHREDGPAKILYLSPINLATEHDDIAPLLLYYKNGKLHRKDGPAIISQNGDEFWYKNGQLHRKDGPAIKRQEIDRLKYDCEAKLEWAKENQKLNKKEEWHMNGKNVENKKRKY